MLYPCIHPAIHNTFLHERNNPSLCRYPCLALCRDLSLLLYLTIEYISIHPFALCLDTCTCSCSSAYRVSSINPLPSRLSHPILLSSLFLYFFVNRNKKQNKSLINSHSRRHSRHEALLGSISSRGVTLYLRRALFTYFRR